MHSLLHVSDSVRDNGMLWTHNAFIYESACGVFRSFLHGNKQQPHSAVEMLSSLHEVQSGLRHELERADLTPQVRHLMEDFSGNRLPDVELLPR